MGVGEMNGAEVVMSDLFEWLVWQLFFEYCVFVQWLMYFGTLNCEAAYLRLKDKERGS